MTDFFIKKIHEKLCPKVSKDIWLDYTEIELLSII